MTERSLWEKSRPLDWQMREWIGKWREWIDKLVQGISKWGNRLAMNGIDWIWGNGLENEKMVCWSNRMDWQVREEISNSGNGTVSKCWINGMDWQMKGWIGEWIEWIRKPDRKIVLGEVKTLDTDSEVLLGFILSQPVVNHSQVIPCYTTRREHLFWNSINSGIFSSSSYQWNSFGCLILVTFQ